MTGAHFTPLQRITVPNGDVLHGLRCEEADFAGFGEAYFTTVLHGRIKGWRRHARMTMNLLVPAGRVRFVVQNDGQQTAFDLTSEQSSYGRLTVKPGCWLAFQGLETTLNLILNIASIPHDPYEAETCALDSFPRDWSLAD